MEVEVDFFLESGMKGVNFILKQKLVFNKSEMKVGADFSQVEDRSVK